MMKKWLKYVGMSVASVALAGAAFAQEFGTREEAKAMTDAAVAHVKKVGPQQAFKDFTEDKTNWVKKDLYVFAYDMKGVNVAHGANPRLIGKNLLELKDPNGKPLIAEMVQITSTKGSGWIDYEWPHPQTKKVESKTSFVRRMENFDGFLGVGVYR
ncbi:MAG: cache domain-containing protein [Burkholderiales bacterium]|jgi:signal transduction histidine kinase|nr:cache domain-containing protein [Burkholderiales bacterium]